MRIAFNVEKDVTITRFWESIESFARFNWQELGFRLAGANAFELDLCLVMYSLVSRWRSLLWVFGQRLCSLCEFCELLDPLSFKFSDVGLLNSSYKRQVVVVTTGLVASSPPTTDVAMRDRARIGGDAGAF